MFSLSHMSAEGLQRTYSSAQCSSRGSIPLSLLNTAAQQQRRYAATSPTASITSLEHTRRLAAGVTRPLEQWQEGRHRQSRTGKVPLKLSWAGAGIYFFWQLGAMQYLAERYDLSRVQMAGASGGALAAVLAVCKVDAVSALQVARRMSIEQDIYRQPLSLLGAWSGFIEEWLDELLPYNAAESCSGMVNVVVCTLPGLAQVGISDFKDKQDLINCCMASSHIPLVLDGCLTRRCRGQECVDGSFPDFFINDNSELLKCGGKAVIFDYFQDPALERKGRMDMLSVRTYEEVAEFMKVGYRYADKLHRQGHFYQYDVSAVSLSPPPLSSSQQQRQTIKLHKAGSSKGSPVQQPSFAAV